MKFENQNEPIERVGIEQGKSFQMKASAAAFQLLSSGLYTNKIRAVLREIGCNAVDAHAMVNKKETPIEVKLPNNLDRSFYIRDFGPGLSHSGVMDLYSTYFESSKQKSNDFIGGFGVGSKSPFAYTDSFTVVSIHQGYKRVYTAYVNEEGFPTISLASDAIPTDEPSGLQVSFPVKEQDQRAFTQESLEVFSAFPVRPTILGQVLDFKPYETIPWTSNVSIYSIDGNTYNRNSYYSREGRARTAQINMGGVRYALPDLKSKLHDQGLTLSEQAAALFSAGIEIHVTIGEVSVAASRETLQYDQRTLKKLHAIFETEAAAVLQWFSDWYDQHADASKSVSANAAKLSEALKKQPWYVEHLAKQMPIQSTGRGAQDKFYSQVFNVALTGRYQLDAATLQDTHNVYLVRGEAFESFLDGRVNAHLDHHDSRKKLVTRIKRMINDGRLFSHHTMVQRRLAIDNSIPFYTMDRSMSPDTALEVLEHLKSKDHRTSTLIAVPKHDQTTKQRKSSSSAAPLQTIIDLPPTAKQISDAAATRELFSKMHDVAFESIPALPIPPAPVKKKREKLLWAIPLTPKATHSTMEVKKTLRGFPSSEIAVALDDEIEDTVGYLVYDRKRSQTYINTTSSSNELLHQYQQYAPYFKSPQALEFMGLPTTVYLITKEDETEFLATAPNAIRFDDAIDDLKNDPVTLGKAAQWIQQRPQVASLGYSEARWVDLYDTMVEHNAAPDSTLYKIAEKWKRMDVSKYDQRKDQDYASFFQRALNVGVPALETINLNSDLKTLRDAYPYMQYFESRTPTEVKIEYIKSQDMKHGVTYSSAKPSAPLLDDAP
jgi:hypothetical protein